MIWFIPRIRPAKLPPAPTNSDILDKQIQFNQSQIEINGLVKKDLDWLIAKIKELEGRLQ
jgi:hypothetical protein